MQNYCVCFNVKIASNDDLMTEYIGFYVGNTK